MVHGSIRKVGQRWDDADDVSPMSEWRGVNIDVWDPGKAGGGSRIVGIMAVKVVRAGVRFPRGCLQLGNLDRWLHSHLSHPDLGQELSPMTESSSGGFNAGHSCIYGGQSIVGGWTLHIYTWTAQSA